MRTFATALALVTFLACEGPVGPEGPAGPEGEPGPGTRQTYQGQLDSQGSTQVNLPAEAGTVSDPPSVTCYVSDTNSGPFISLAFFSVYDSSTDTSGTGACGFGSNGSTLAVIIYGAPPNWVYRVVVVHWCRRSAAGYVGTCTPTVAWT